MKTKRCDWCGEDPLYVRYHDEEWGVPEHDDKKLFELLLLEGAQAGLSWITVLRKRESYRAAFDNFDAELIARYDATDVTRLLANPGIVRNRLKISSAIGNATERVKPAARSPQRRKARTAATASGRSGPIARRWCLS